MLGWSTISRWGIAIAALVVLAVALTMASRVVPFGESLIGAVLVGFVAGGLWVLLLKWLRLAGLDTGRSEDNA